VPVPNPGVVPAQPVTPVPGTPVTPQPAVPPGTPPGAAPAPPGAAPTLPGTPPVPGAPPLPPATPLPPGATPTPTPQSFSAVFAPRKLGVVPDGKLVPPLGSVSSLPAFLSRTPEIGTLEHED
jgi:hypothetical protein